MFDRMNRLFFFGLVILAVFNCIVCEVKKNSNADKNACPEESDEAWSFDQCKKHSDKGKRVESHQAFTNVLWLSIYFRRCLPIV